MSNQFTIVTDQIVYSVAKIDPTLTIEWKTNINGVCYSRFPGIAGSYGLVARKAIQKYGFKLTQSGMTWGRLLKLL